MKSYIESNPAVRSIHVIWGPIALLFIITAGFFKDFVGLLPPCIFHRLTGIPCLTCGGVRSLVALSQFDVASSFLLNPMVFVFAAGVVVFSLVSLYGLIFARNIVLRLDRGQKKALRIGAISLIIVNWLYLIAADI